MPPLRQGLAGVAGGGPCHQVWSLPDSPLEEAALLSVPLEDLETANKRSNAEKNARVCAPPLVTTDPVRGNVSEAQ